MKIVIDMMGGDNGLKATISATKEFLKLHPGVELFLVGDENKLNECKGKDNIHIFNSDTILAMDVDPLSALKEATPSLEKVKSSLSKLVFISFSFSSICSSSFNE